MHILKSSIYHSSFEKRNTFATVQTHKYQKESLDMVYCLLMETQQSYSSNLSIWTRLTSSLLIFHNFSIWQQYLAPLSLRCNNAHHSTTVLSVP